MVHHLRLDGLRAVAVVSVMVFHWHHPTIGGRPLPLGFLGVQLFFVLSGFLIGGILLRCDAENRRRGRSSWPLLARFMARRALRIFPAFFVFLAVTGILLGAPDSQWWWYPAYLGNVRIAAIPFWPTFWSHTWTLAVEEQFYLIAPLLILRLGREQLRRCLVVVLACATAWILLTTPSPSLRLVPPEAFYGLFVGLALAVLWEHGDPLGARARRFVTAGSLLVACVAFVFDLQRGRVFEVAVSICFAGVVVWATGSSPSRVGALLEQRLVVHLGALSYGLYLWHMPMTELVDRLQLGHLPTGVLTVGLFASTYAAARLSWELVERPFNRLKRRVPYLPSEETPLPSTPEREPRLLS